MKTILQSEAAECGLSCLAMIADSYGYKSDLNSLRNKYTQTLKGVNLQQLINIADELNLAGRALKLTLEQLGHLKLPCIIHWDMNHFVVLLSVSNKSVTIVDPAIGKRTLSLESISDHFTGIALELTPTKAFKKQDVRVKMRLSQFIHSVNGLKPVLFQLFALSCILQVFALASPYYMQLAIDEVIVSFDQSLLSMLALGFGLVVLLNVATSALRGFVVIHLGATLNQQLAFNLFQHLMRLPLSFFSKRHMGDIVSRFGSLEQIKQMLTTAMVEAVIDGIMAVMTLVMIYLYSPQLAWVVSAAMLLYLLLRCLWYRPLHEISEEAIVADATENTNFMENVRAMQTIKLFGIEAKRQALWQNHYTKALNLNVRVERLNLAYNLSKNFLFGVENVLVIFLGSQLVMASGGDEIFTIGMFMAFMAYKMQLIQRFSSLVDKLIEFKMLGLHLERLSDLAQAKQESHLHSKQNHDMSGQLSINNISFRHSSGEPYLFQNLRATFEPGECVAIVGASGGGKTTLMKVMLGLYQPESGEVTVDGKSLDELGHLQYRRQIATVMQSDELLSGSIAENIGQFDPNLDIDSVKVCAKMAAIDQDIMAMTMQYNSLVGDLGSSLSGGQKQRVLLARALYRSPKILFLDEATSHLDIASESAVNRSLSELNITRILIAHRKETIQMADRVLELRDGQLFEVTAQYKSISKITEYSQ
ncbi:peptidase domain-containing ABC transporter [Photobacterium arenosum]|uniref:peptidase domain-containing ABC transporter n=1 Tax=Photobacterium arenosum TaxID=2774143 RepID=UPI0028898740|nr:peptidase domain-containing ABC transporter [Photobacterium arenosum]